MNVNDLATLTRAFAPVIKDYVEQAIAERTAALEKRLGAIETKDVTAPPTRKIRAKHCGNWVPTQSYQQNDGVLHANAFWFCRTGNSAKRGTGARWWNLLDTTRRWQRLRTSVLVLNNVTSRSEAIEAITNFIMSIVASHLTTFASVMREQGYSEDEIVQCVLEHFERAPVVEVTSSSLFGSTLTG